MLLEAKCVIAWPSVSSNWSYCPQNAHIRDKSSIFRPVWLTFDWWPHKTPRLYYFKLCASFPSHRGIQNGVAVRKLSILVESGDFFSCTTLKFDGWPLKTKGHLFYASSSFVCDIVANYEFKLKKIPLTSVTLTFDLWPWAFAWTSLLSMLITPEDFVMIWW